MMKSFSNLIKELFVERFLNVFVQYNVEINEERTVII